MKTLCNQLASMGLEPLRVILPSVLKRALIRLVSGCGDHFDGVDFFVQ